ncbi:hypothetical protein AB833_29475 [Chromatiales bacterium (ex Bugula neritina AB1)]|nr:hypothetical protein AB833_29475 [Chromatiales bacterium (ex Bugula neritina AB1)]
MDPLPDTLKKTNSPDHKEVPLTGYTDRLSARPGETIEFKVSCTTKATEVTARLMRSICADPNPAGPGIIEQNTNILIEPFPARYQPFNPGSYAITKNAIPLSGPIIELSATVFPTLHKASEQCLIYTAGIALSIDECGHAVLSVAGRTVSSGYKLPLRRWSAIQAIVDRVSSIATIEIKSDNNTVAAASEHPIDMNSLDLASASETLCTIAARPESNDFSATEIKYHFNGKIEAPRLREATEAGDFRLVAEWNFSRQISTTTALDDGPHAAHAALVNLPARAVTSSKWDGGEMCWRHAPDHYAAIHFHDDDIVAFDWQTDFTFTVPPEMPSGVYVMRIKAGDNEDAMPFYVCPPVASPASKVCVLIPTFTYAVYGNHARPDWNPDWHELNKKRNAYPWNPAEYPAYGQSTYNFHSDGSGICHASHERPLFNLRPGYITFGQAECSGLRHFQADSHLITWLHNNNIDFDIITDRELHNEGTACIESYQALLTTSHPEYHTPQSLQALTDYRDQGGNLLYLGGNGFYWRIALHKENPNTIEIRRAEDGIRAWAAEPGEYYQAFDGAYGGLWRRNGRPPQDLCGVGFSAQGQFNGSYYRRRAVSDELAWVFEGIDEEIIGDFGLCGGGAAGFELDRADTRLGTPETATILARSEAHGHDFILVPEEMLTHITTLPGAPAEDLIHADMIWFEAPGGGSVFSVGSITFCGSLPHKNFDNNISRLLLNVVNHVLAPAE